MAGETEHGYDVDQILQRRRAGRPRLGSAASTVESVRLAPELKRDLLLRAAQDHTSVSEVTRRAIGDYLRAG
ncbi:MAG TPA: CopG family transcriptional regulator [Actinomycetota bacterium]|nr:CopG family transcriptional regulator [Actinomycetota bacterium]